MFRLLLLLSVLCMVSCGDAAQETEPAQPGSVYFDYQVWADDASEFVTVMLQFRTRKNGGTVFLKAPSQVTLDGQLLQADSSKMTGAFYEGQYPAGPFAGGHTIEFTGINNKTYRETFHFSPFTFSQPIPDTLQRGDLDFMLNGIEPHTAVRIVLTDTSRYHDGINRVDTLQNGQLRITRDQLRRIASGPVQLELIKELEKAIKNGTPAGGRLVISQGLRKEFWLKD